MKRGICESALFRCAIDDVDLVFRFRTHNTVPVGWLINSDSVLAGFACLTCCCCCCCCCSCCLARRLAWRFAHRSVNNRFRLSTRRTIPFGWLMKLAGEEASPIIRDYRWGDTTTIIVDVIFVVFIIAFK